MRFGLVISRDKGELGDLLGKMFFREDCNPYRHLLQARVSFQCQRRLRPRWLSPVEHRLRAAKSKSIAPGWQRGSRIRFERLRKVVRSEAQGALAGIVSSQDQCQAPQLDLGGDLKRAVPLDLKCTD